jgi:hypothetical protein
MTYRYFAADPAVYEQVRIQLNAAWGLPNERGTATCFLPASNAYADEQGRALLCVLAEWCEWPAVAAVLPGLLEDGVIEEIDGETYWSHAPGVPA